MDENENLLSLVVKVSEGKGKMNLILPKTKMCTDKVGLALGLCFECVAYNGDGKTVFTTPSTLEIEKSKINTPPQPTKKKPAAQLLKKKPTPQPKRATQPKMKVPLREPRVMDNPNLERCYQFTNFHRKGYLVRFCFRRRRDEWHEW